MSFDTRRQRVTNRQEVLILSKLEQLSAVEHIADVYPTTPQPHPQQRVALAMENGYNLKFYYPATDRVAFEDVKWDVFFGPIFKSRRSLVPQVMWQTETQG